MTRPRWSRHVATNSLFALLPGVALFAAASYPAVADTPAITSETPAARHTAGQAKALAERAVVHIRAVGRDHAFADFTRPDGGFVDRERCVSCHDVSGGVVAHGGNPKLVGKNLAGARDTEGKQPILEVVRLGLAKGQAWLEYPWPNPELGQVQRKMTHVLRIDDRTVCGSGYYKASPL